MNFITAAAKFNKDVDKKMKLYETVGCGSLEDAVRTESAKWKRTLETAIMLRDIAIETCFIQSGEPLSNKTFFITVRPGPNAVSFETFKHLVLKEYLTGKMFEQWAVTFEQKDPHGSGEGFHCHIMAKCSVTGKHEVLRRTTCFKGIVADNCIDVRVCKTPETTFKNYCIDYKSDDGHKILTREGDVIWRAVNNIDPYYISKEPLKGLGCAP